jgi:hypothetical protein
MRTRKSDQPATDQPPSGQPILATDWTQEPSELAAGQIPEQEIKTPAQTSVAAHRESTRSQLARWLMALLTVTVLSILLLAGLQVGGVIGTAGIPIRDLSQIALTPVVALTGTALGFYFGAQSLSGAETETLTAPREPGKIRKVWRWIW